VLPEVDQHRSPAAFLIGYELDSGHLLYFPCKSATRQPYRAPALRSRWAVPHSLTPETSRKPHWDQSPRIPLSPKAWFATGH
jgi:hypothetical protein